MERHQHLVGQSACIALWRAGLGVAPRGCAEGRGVPDWMVFDLDSKYPSSRTLVERPRRSGGVPDRHPPTGAMNHILRHGATNCVNTSPCHRDFDRPSTRHTTGPVGNLCPWPRRGKGQSAWTGNERHRRGGRCHLSGRRRVVECIFPAPSGGGTAVFRGTILEKIGVLDRVQHLVQPGQRIAFAAGIAAASRVASAGGRRYSGCTASPRLRVRPSTAPWLEREIDEGVLVVDDGGAGQIEIAPQVLGPDLRVLPHEGAEQADDRNRSAGSRRAPTRR